MLISSQEKREARQFRGATLGKSPKRKLKQAFLYAAESFFAWLLRTRLIRVLKKTQDQLAQYETLVHYMQPSYDELQKMQYRVCSSFKDVRLEPTKQCENVSRETRVIKFKLITLEREDKTKSILKKMEKQKLRPAMYEELLAFVNAYPEVCDTRLIVALGSAAHHRGGLAAPFFYQDSVGRRLSMDWHECVWDESCRFLVVPKKKRVH